MSRVPTATYRLQFHAGCTFVQATRLLPYLANLGISDLYASPLFQARRGSLHGYSVTNPLQLNRELGSPARFEAMVRKLQSLDLGLVLDVVPNHMALSHSNPWWQDVLENGQSSPYAVFFDIEWDPPYRSLKNRVLIPILGRPYGQCLEDQELTLHLSPEGFAVHYYDHRFPLDPKSYLSILSHRLDDLKAALGADNPDMVRILGVISLIHNLPPRTVASLKKRRERLHWRDIIKKNLWLLYDRSPNLREFLDENLRQFNGQRGDPASFTLLDQLLREQPYRLAHWLVSLEMINYRRFFSINDLIGIRVEDPQVFTATHGLLLKLVEEGKVTGLRLDHIDGLKDPAAYLQRLQAELQKRRPTAGHGPCYVVVEKILERDEPLPPSWPVAGTTGYDFLGVLNNLFITAEGLAAIEADYRQVTGITGSWADMVYEKKKFIMASLFGGELHNLEEELATLAAADRQAMDVSRHDLLAALTEISACLPVYRTYTNNYLVTPSDRAAITAALAEARRRQPDLAELAVDFLRRVLLLQCGEQMTDDQKKSWLRFVCRWQQFTGPIMAKGMEDTAAYVYNPLLSRNEVGGCRQAVTPADFHAFCQERLRRWPDTMNATSTHDTKRSEDVRARLNVLTEMPQLWRQKLETWRAWHATRKRILNGAPVPDVNEEIFLYQTLLGAWPLDPAEVPAFQERLQHYLIKALREAKVHSRWIEPRLDYEQAVRAFVADILKESPTNDFLPDFLAFQEELAYFGALNSLAQVLLKIAAPGVPDFYQGTELWDFSLVDPDNRRPVDFARRQKLLQELQARERAGAPSFLGELLVSWRDGRVKLFLTYKALQVRQRSPELFRVGAYIPLAVAGPAGDHVVAFARQRQGDWVLAATGRVCGRRARPGRPTGGTEGGQV
ncbi:MAG: malto-oligosyltrehalose synthase, partial [Desulfobacca sp.]|uniref:malto-oligosyltrehalose synthase n=1 Tax=Desulfobacca sp. TaxID=2067990 RepID=UPI00404AC02D